MTTKSMFLIIAKIQIICFTQTKAWEMAIEEGLTSRPHAVEFRRNTD